MDLVSTIALSMGTAWASGINLYAAVLMLGLLGATGHADLPPDLEPLTHPLVIMAAAFMYVVEFFADKVPGVDSGWDTVHTFVRIPAGAVLAAAAMGEVSMPAQIAAALLGGTLAAGTHAAKAGTRVLINTSPEPLSNWCASIAEDLAVVAGLWAALRYPWLFVALLVLFVLLLAWLLPRLGRALWAVFAGLRRLLGGRERAVAPGAERPPPGEAAKALEATEPAGETPEER